MPWIAEHWQRIVAEITPNVLADPIPGMVAGYVVITPEWLHLDLVFHPRSTLESEYPGGSPILAAQPVPDRRGAYAPRIPCHPVRRTRQHHRVQPAGLRGDAPPWTVAGRRRRARSGQPRSKRRRSRTSGESWISHRRSNATAEMATDRPQKQGHRPRTTDAPSSSSRTIHAGTRLVHYGFPLCTGQHPQTSTIVTFWRA